MSVKFKVGPLGIAPDPPIPSSEPAVSITPLTWAELRNANWPAMPTVTTSEEKLVCLLGLTRGNDNFVSFYVEGNFTVDWGDGSSPENYSSGTTAYHYYDYNTVSSSTFDDGVKTVFFTITPQGGAQLTKIYFHYIPAGDTWHDYYWSTQMLEIKASLPNIVDIFFNNKNNSGAPYEGFFIQAITLLGNMPNLITPALFRYMKGLKYVKMDLTGTTSGDYSYMFNDCFSLTDLSDLTLKSTFTNATYMFAGCISLIDVPLFNLSSVTDALGMFQSCWALQTVPLFNLSSLTNMSNMFYDCQSLKSVPLFNLSNVTNFDSAFRQCYALKTVPLFDLSSVTQMNSTFENSYSINYIPNFNTVNCQSFVGTFINCYSLATAPNLNMSSAINVESMFNGCYSFKKGPNYDLSNVTHALGFLANCHALEYVPQYNLSSCTNAAYMFAGCEKIKEITPPINTSNIANFYNMFEFCYSLIRAPMFDTSGATNMNAMFKNCSSLEYVPTYNTSNCTSFFQTFWDCRALQTGPNWDLSKATNLQSMFAYCRSLISTPNYSLPQADDLSGMFQYCQRLEVSPSLANTANVTRMNSMFNDCYNLKIVPNMTTNNVIYMDYMFYQCHNLTNLPNLNVTNVTGMQQIFQSTALMKLPTWDTRKVQNIRYFVNGTLLHELPSWNVAAVTADVYMDTRGTESRISYSGLYGGRFTINYRDNILSANALNVIFTNVGTADPSSSKIIYIGNNPGATNCNTAIATAKGWTVVN